MDETRFWSLMESLDSTDDAAFATLTNRLATLSGEEITAFEDCLARALHDLDTPAHAAAVGAANDWFLYVRCAAVAGGRTAYREALRHPRRFGRFADEEAEGLLYVARKAYERSTGLAWDHEPPVGYEMGDNHAAWGTPPPEEAPSLGGWLVPLLGFGMSTPVSDAYADSLFEVVDRLNQAEPWQEWWATAQKSRLEIEGFFGEDLGPPKLLVRPGRKLVRVEWVVPSERLHHPDLGELQRRATADIWTVLAAARDRLGLPPLPPPP